MEEFKTCYSDIDVKKEWFEPGSSETEEGQSVSIKTIYERCLRGEMVPQDGNFYYEREVGVFEHPDTDLADVSIVTDYLATREVGDKPEENSQDGAALHVASDGQEKVSDGEVKQEPK